MAFVAVNVVPMDRPHVLREQTVVTEGDRIVAVGPMASLDIPVAAEIIDGRGKYIMPGLADMHVHLRHKSDLLLYLGNGITTVRNMSGTPKQLAWRQQVADGSLIGPTIATAGPVLFSRRNRRAEVAYVRKVPEVRKAVAEQKAAGYDFIKVHDFLTPEFYQAATQAARAHEIPVVGHVPFAVGMAAVIAAGQHSIEHLSGFAAHIQKPGSPFRGKVSWHDRVRAFGHVDETRIGPVAASIRDAGIWSCPTLVSAERLVPGALARKWLKRPEVRLLHTRYGKQWSRIGRRTKGQKWDSAAADHANQIRLQIVAALHRTGARLLLGTDAMAPFVVPGFTIHDELTNLVRAGLTPFEALRAGTSDAGEFLGQSFGLVAPGQRADLLMLSANPLENTANIRRITGIMTRGRWIPPTEMQRLFQDRRQAMAQEIPKRRSR